MAKYILRRVLLLFMTMLLVSIGVFLITEASPGNVARNILSIYITPEQEASFLAQTGLDKPIYLRYIYWMFGSDWHASSKVGLKLKRLSTDQGFQEWWAVDEEDRLIRWKIVGDDLIATIRVDDGSTIESNDNRRWKKNDKGTLAFWGVHNENSAVQWEQGTSRKLWTYIDNVGWKESSSGAIEFIPLKKGFTRGDPGISLVTGRPVANSLFVRLRNTLVISGLAFIIVMPLALLLGLIAGLKEGSAIDRVLSIGGMIFTIQPMFVTGIFLILIFSLWLDILPGAVALGDKAPWERPDMLILPVLTLTLIELGYVLRITRASMVEVMRTPYIRTAILKGLPYWYVVFGHSVRNALVAPITIIMLHANFLLGGTVVVEAVFGYPGLGTYLLESALNKDINALESGAMILVVVAVGTQLMADIIYTFLNPRIRYT